jgi:hypothetical protein
VAGATGAGASVSFGALGAFGAFVAGAAAAAFFLAAAASRPFFRRSIKIARCSSVIAILCFNITKDNFLSFYK